MRAYHPQGIPAAVKAGGFEMNVSALSGGQPVIAVDPSPSGYINPAAGARHYILEGGERDTPAINQNRRVVCGSKNKGGIIDPSSAHVDLGVRPDLYIAFAAFKTNVA